MGNLLLERCNVFPPAAHRRRAWCNPARRVVHVREAAIKKIQRVQPDRHPSLFRQRDCRGVLWRFAGTKKKTMKCLTILCLSLGLAGCCCTGPYASANGNGPVVDLSACADSADLRVDPLRRPLTRTQRK